MAVRRCVYLFQNLKVLSSLAEAISLPSPEKATELTLSLCPFSVAISLLFKTSQSLTVLSSPAEASVLPSGAKATQFAVAS